MRRKGGAQREGKKGTGRGSGRELQGEWGRETHFKVQAGLGDRAEKKMDIVKELEFEAKRKQGTRHAKRKRNTGEHEAKQ